LRAGRAPLPPPRQPFERRPERALRTAAELRDPLPDANDFDAKVRAARKRGPQLRVAAAKEIDANDPLGEDVANYDERVGV
jgi:hypothetical protein